MSNHLTCQPLAKWDDPPSRIDQPLQSGSRQVFTSPSRGSIQYVVTLPLPQWQGKGITNHGSHNGRLLVTERGFFILKDGKKVDSFIIHYHTVSYIIIHYHTLSYIIIHYHTLSYIIIHYHTLSYIIIHYHTLSYIIIHYHTLSYIIIHYHTLSYIIIHYHTLSYIIIHYLDVH